MPTLRSIVFDRNTGFAGLAALIGVRCFPKQIPEGNAYPQMTYNTVSRDDSQYRTHDNVNVQPTRAVSRVQMNAYGTTGDSAAAVADQIVAAWGGFKDGCTVGRAFVANRFDTYETGINKYREVVDVMIEHTTDLS